MERTVAFEVLRLVDKAILAAQIGVDDAEIVPDRFTVLVEKHGAASLFCKLVEGFQSVGEDCFWLGAEDVDCRVRLLADVDVVCEAAWLALSMPSVKRRMKLPAGGSDVPN